MFYESDDHRGRGVGFEVEVTLHIVRDGDGWFDRVAAIWPPVWQLLERKASAQIPPLAADPAPSSGTVATYAHREVMMDG